MFFAAALAPIAVIPARAGFAAYVAFPGLTLAAGCLLDTARVALVRWRRAERYRECLAIAWFLLVAFGAGQYHLRIRNRLLPYVYEWHHPLRKVMTLMQQRIPDTPPDFRMLMLEDAFPAHDWEIYFLTQMLYHDPTVRLNRERNLDHPPDLAAYALIVRYQASPLDRRGHQTGVPVFTVAAEHPVKLVRAGDRVTLTVPGLADAEIDAVYRLDGEVHRVINWCPLDGAASCTVAVPSGNVVMDWVRPRNGQWLRVRQQVE